MRSAWQLQEAKNKLSEVVDSALRDGPQTITRHGRPAVVVIAFEEYEKARGEKLSSVLRSCPAKGWIFSRDKDTGRTVRFD